MINQEKLQNKELFIIVLVFALPLMVMVFIYLRQGSQTTIPPNIEQRAQPSIEVNSLKAETAMVTELNTGKILFELNKKEIRPIASITKLFTTLVAEENFRKRGIEKVEITNDALKPNGDSGLLVGQVWKISDLIDYTLITSSNDGAKALALSAFDNDENNFISEMNIFARKHGLANTQFVNETGLDTNSEQEAGAVSTAEDLTKVLKYIVENKLEDFAGTANFEDKIIVGDKIYNSQNTNELVKSLPNVLVSKTGYTDLAGGNLAMVVDFGLNNPISIVVLGSTAEERERDVLKLYQATSDYYLQNLRRIGKNSL